MRMHTFECQMIAPLSMQETFAVFQDPYNLARITPPALDFVIESKDVRVSKGARIDYRLRWLGLPIRWTSLITEYEPPFVFTDEMVKGPYAIWRHRHTFRPSLEGTVVADRVEYALPFGPVGVLAYHLLVRRQVEQIFRFRQKALAEIFDTTAVSAR